MRLFRGIQPLLLASFLLLDAPANAQHPGDVYWGVSAGPYWSFDNESADADVKFDTGFAGAAQIGYIFEAIRADVEFEYSRVDVDKIGSARTNTDLQTYRASFSLYDDCFEKLGKLREIAGWKEPILPFVCVDVFPYIGAGLGVSRQILDGELDDEKTALTAHGEFGFSFASSRHLEMVAAYRFEWFESNLDGLDDSPLSQQLRIGIRFFY